MPDPPPVPETTQLASFLEARDVACPRCRYNLRDLKGSRCPECGEDLVLRVGAAHPRLAWFITGLVGLSVGFGFFAIFLLFLVYSRITRGFPDFDEPESVAVLCTTPVLGLLMLGWIVARRRMPRSSWLRWVLAAVAWVFGIVPAILFFVLANW